MLSTAAEITRRTACRVCGGTRLIRVLSLGFTPPANAFLRHAEVGSPERSFPLELYFCEDCSFVQLLDIVSPELLFRNYVYVSSTSKVFVAHFEALAKELHERYHFPPNSLIVDIGSNDGILLKPFQRLGWRVLGVDPATAIAETAKAAGIPTKPDFFTPEVADEIVRDNGYAKLVTATSAFPHIDDLDNLVAGIKKLLADDGVFVIEAYYLLDLLRKNLFDTVYHEHLSYFSVSTLTHLFGRLDMEVIDVEHTDTHGGSLRVSVQRRGGRHLPNRDAIQKFLDEEAAFGLAKKETYTAFARTVEENKHRLCALLADLKARGKKIVGFGAPAKGNTLLNYFGIGRETLDYIIDDSAWKQGLLTPGTRIPVVGSEELQKNPPDYLLILAWNFARPIMNRFPEQRFIIPVPRPVTIEDVVDQDLYAIAEGLGGLSQKLSGKTLLITGGSGFLGSYMVAAVDFLNKNFLDTPCRVITVDNHLVGRKNNLVKDITSPHIIFKEHDVCLPFSVEEPVDYIMSAAGVASPVYYKQYPIETIEGTIFGVKNSLELARQKGAKSFLYFSSSEIYGDPDPNFIPTPETYKGNVSSIGPRSCYDESKRVGETLVLAYHQVHRVPTKIVRPFNVFGPGMSSKDYRVIPTFLSQGLSGQPILVHDKGNQTRTFCYVTDAITGFFKVLLSGRDGEVYNIGNDQDEINMLGLADTIVKHVFGGKAEAALAPYPDRYPQDEPRRRCPDLRKAHAHVGYRPQVDLKTGLKRAYLWFQSRGI